MMFIRRHAEILILTAAALLTRLWGIFTPAKVVFDEVYFKVYAGDYLTGAYYFDPHPPLGKLLLGGWAWLLHLDPSVVADPQAASVALRTLPAIAGALIIPVFFIFLRQLGAGRRAATLGAALLLLENALLVESRFILIDSLLILFGLSAVTAYLAARRQPGRSRRRLLLVILSAFLAGLCLSTKWTGLSAIGLIGVVWLYDQIRHHRTFNWRTRIAEAVALAIIPLAVYMSVFAVHFSLLPKSGQGDAFMSPTFQSTLIGNAAYNPAVHMRFLEKFLELNLAMNNSEKSLQTATHPYGSKWTSWPLMIRGVYYWQGDTLPNGTQGNIYLLGNPVVWWGILAVILGGALASTQALSRLRKYRFAFAFLALAYVVNFLPFSHIVRVMFLYHYFFALIFSLAFAVILLSALADWMEDSPRHPWRFSSPFSKWLYIGVISVAVIGFLYFAPLSYGTPLSPSELNAHMWLKTWR